MSTPGVNVMGLLRNEGTARKTHERCGDESGAGRDGSSVGFCQEQKLNSVLRSGQRSRVPYPI